MRSLALNLASGRLRFSPVRFLKGVRWSDGKVLLACMGFGFLVRLVPELLAWPLPIGFDTVYYAVAMKSGVVWAHWSTFFTSSWLLYAFIVPLYGLLQVDPFLLLKVVAPLLFGLNVAGIYWFSRKLLGWKVRMGVLAGVFFALQLASLRISWDLLRNTLGMGILLFALAYVNEVDSKRGFALFTVLSLLSVFAHEYAAVTLLVVVLGLVVWRLVKRHMVRGSSRLFLGVLPTLAVFVVGLGLQFFPVSYGTETSARVIGTGEAISVKAGGLFFMENYLSANSSATSYAGYWDLALNVGLLFAVLFLPYIFLVAKGFFRNGVLDLWTSMLVVGAFGCLLVPFAALTLWWRWMFMLVYPLTFYALSGLRRLFDRSRERKIRFFSLISSKKSAVIVLLTFGLGAAYLATPVLIAFAGASVPLFPSTSLYFSTSPCVPYEDVEGVIQAMNWLNSNMDQGSSVVLQYVFLSWGQLYLDKSHTIVNVHGNVDLAVNTAFDHGFTRVFFVYWNQPIGWTTVAVPERFVSVQDFGRITVYAYQGLAIGS